MNTDFKMYPVICVNVSQFHCVDFNFRTPKILNLPQFFNLVLSQHLIHYCLSSARISFFLDFFYKSDITR